MPKIRNIKDIPPRGGNWSKLETPGDVRRFLRWLILQTKEDKIDTRKAGVLGQLGLYLLKSIEVATIVAQVASLEQRLDHTQENQPPHEPSNAHTTH
jgi:hypothetical protein